MSDSPDQGFQQPHTANPVLHAQLEAQVGYFSTLSRQGYDLLARVSELNMQLAREALDDAIATGQQLAGCSDPLQLGAVAMRGLQPAGEHLRNYQQQIMHALAEAQSRMGQAPPLVVATPPTGSTRRRS